MGWEREKKERNFGRSRGQTTPPHSVMANVWWESDPLRSIGQPSVFSWHVGSWFGNKSSITMSQRPRASDPPCEIQHPEEWSQTLWSCARQKFLTQDTSWGWFWVLNSKVRVFTQTHSAMLPRFPWWMNVRDQTRPSVALVHFVIDRARLFTNRRISSRRFPTCQLGRTLFCMASQLPLVPLTFALFVLFINWINIFQFWFLDCPFLFLSVLRGFPILIQATGHMWSGRDVVWIFVSLPPDHICPLGRNSFKDVNLVKPVHESDRFLFPSTFQQSSIRFVCCNVQIGLRWPDEINFLQWNWEWHEKLNSWFNVTTIKWNLLNRPEVFPRHLLFLQVESLPCRLEILRWDSLSPCGGFPSQCEWVLGIRSLYLTILLNHLQQEMQILQFFWVIKATFAFSLLGHISDASNFPIHQYQQSECLLSKLTNFSLCLSRSLGDVPPVHQMGYSSFKRFPNKSSFMRSFPVCQQILHISRIAVAFHRIWPPLFIQSRLQ